MSDNVWGRCFALTAGKLGCSGEALGDGRFVGPRKAKKLWRAAQQNDRACRGAANFRRPRGITFATGWMWGSSVMQSNFKPWRRG